MKEDTPIRYFKWGMRLVVVALILISFNHHRAPYHPRSVPILVYHLIDTYPGYGEQGLYVSPENFKQQMIYLKTHGFTPLTFEDWDTIDRVKKPIFITFDDGYKDNNKMWDIFNSLSDSSFLPKATIFVIANDIGKPNHLDKKDIERMADSPYFSIQSHTVTHPNLTKSKDLNTELGLSKSMIETVTHKPVIAIAYPYGQFNKRVIEKAADYYQFGVTTLPGFYKKNWIPYENYLMPRLYVTYSTNLNTFKYLVTHP